MRYLYQFGISLLVFILLISVNSYSFTQTTDEFETGEDANTGVNAQYIKDYYKVKRLIGFLKLNDTPLCEVVKSKDPVFKLEGELNSFGSVVLNTNKDIKVSTGKIDNLYELKRNINHIYVVRAELKPNDNLFWQKVALINPFTTIIRPDNPNFDPYDFTREPESSNVSSSFNPLYINPDVLEVTPYFSESSREIMISPGDLIIDAREYENKQRYSIRTFKTYVEENTGLFTDSGINELKEFDSNDLGKIIIAPTDETPDNDEQPTPNDVVINLNTNRYFDIETDLSKYEYRNRNMYFEIVDIYRYDILEDIKTEQDTDKLNALVVQKEIIEEFLSEYKKVMVATSALISAIKRVHLAKTTDELISFDTANMYVLDDDGKSIPYEVGDGDQLRIQVFRLENSMSYSSRSETIPTLESEIYVEFRDYGHYFNFSPAIFYCTEISGMKAGIDGPRNLNYKDNFNLIENRPSPGMNIYYQYVGNNRFYQFLNWIPGISMAMIGYKSKPYLDDNDPTGITNLVKEYQTEYTGGFSWSIPSLRDLVNFQFMFYGWDYNHKLIGISVSPKMNFDTIIKNSETETYKLK